MSLILMCICLASTGNESANSREVLRQDSVDNSHLVSTQGDDDESW